MTENEKIMIDALQRILLLLRGTRGAAAQAFVLASDTLDRVQQDMKPAMPDTLTLQTDGHVAGAWPFPQTRLDIRAATEQCRECGKPYRGGLYCDACTARFKTTGKNR